jgi:hypothetical protein
MTPKESVLRLKRFEAEEKARRVADLDATISAFEQMALDLERQIASEEERTGIKDINHFAYSTFAKSAAQRRDNLRTSVDGLKAQREAAILERDEAIEDLAKAEAGVERDGDRTRRRGERGSGAVMG